MSRSTFWSNQEQGVRSIYGASAGLQLLRLRQSILCSLLQQNSASSTECGRATVCRSGDPLHGCQLGQAGLLQVVADYFTL